MLPFYNLRKNLLPPYHTLFILFSSVLFFLLVSTPLFAGQEEDFARYELQLRDHQITPDEFIVSVISVDILKAENKEIDPVLLATRDRLVGMGLGCPDINKTLCAKLIMRGGEKIPKQENLLKLLLASGFKFEKTSGYTFLNLPSLEALHFILSIFDPNTCLDMLMNYCNVVDCKTLRTKQELLVNYVLDNGADPKTLSTIRTLPSLRTCELLVRRGFEPTKLLQIIAGCDYCCDEISLYKQLVELLLQRGGNPNSIISLSSYHIPSADICALLLKYGLNPSRLHALILKRTWCSTLSSDDIEANNVLLELAQKSPSYLPSATPSLLEEIRTQEFEPNSVEFSKVETITT